MKRILLIILLLTYASILFADEKLSIGVGWPYVSVKYNLSNKFSTDLRYATGDGINVYAGRFYWNFHRFNNIKLFTGLEVGNIDFNTLDIKGNGSEYSVFAGGEYFISKRLSFVMDFAPTFISLNSQNVGVDGIEWVMNMAVHYYIF